MQLTEFLKANNLELLVVPPADGDRYYIGCIQESGHEHRKAFLANEESSASCDAGARGHSAEDIKSSLIGLVNSFDSIYLRPVRHGEDRIAIPDLLTL